LTGLEFLRNSWLFLLAKTRLKDGKEHRYWSIVEDRRTQGGWGVVQRQVLYLGEINDGQKASWCKTIEVVQEDTHSGSLGDGRNELSLSIVDNQ
jgi:hypothetical protein